jgi:hypothetical protein
MITGKSMWPFFLLIASLCHGDTFTSKKFEDEAGGTSNRYAGGLIQSALKDDSHYTTLRGVNRAAASSGPSPFVHDEFLRSIAVIDEAVSSDVSSRSQWFNYAKREAGESNWRSIWRLESIEGYRVDFVGNLISRFTDSQIQTVVDVAVGEYQPFDVKRSCVSFPSIVRNVDCHGARNGTLKSNLFKVRNHVCSRNEVAGVVNKKPSAIGQLAIKLPLDSEGSAEHGYDGLLYSVNRMDEGVGLGRQAQGDKKHKAEKKEKAETRPPTSGSMVIQNDGKFTGCVASHDSSSSISLSCPQIDSVGAHREAPQKAKRDPSVQPPSQE